MGYSGWVNWETWLTALYINNEEGTQDEARAVCLADTPEYEAAQNLRGWAEETLLNVEGHEGILADIVNGFAAEVSWREIVQSFRTAACDASFERFSLALTWEDAMSASQGGKDAAEDVEELLKLEYIRAQLAKVDDETLRVELKDYGAWDEDELADRGGNERRVVWLAASYIREECTR